MATSSDTVRDTTVVAHQEPLQSPEPVDTGRYAPLTGRGVYATAAVASSKRLLTLADSLLAAGGNTLVFDIKDRDGVLSHRSSVPLARQTQAEGRVKIAEPLRLVRGLQARGLHVVARISCFYDESLVGARPDLAPRTSDGGPWGKGWLDPASEEVQDYLLALMDEVVGFGVDEIQLDYVRFPTEEGVEEARFAIPDTVAKHRVITGFVRRARERLGGRVMLSADIFGVAAWGRMADVERTGQHLPDLVPLLDVVCPMLYPSHFYGNFLGVDNPVEYPYYLVFEGVRRILPLAREHAVAVRPWVQAFPYRIPEYDVAYVSEQLQAADDAGADGWLLWHPASRYDIGLRAMREVTEGRFGDPHRPRTPVSVQPAVSGPSSSPPAAADPSSPSGSP